MKPQRNISLMPYTILIIYLWECNPMTHTALWCWNPQCRMITDKNWWPMPYPWSNLKLLLLTMARAYNTRSFITMLWVWVSDKIIKDSGLPSSFLLAGAVPCSLQIGNRKDSPLCWIAEQYSQTIPLLLLVATFYRCVLRKKLYYLSPHSEKKFSSWRTIIVMNVWCYHNITDSSLHPVYYMSCYY